MTVGVGSTLSHIIVRCFGFEKIPRGGFMILPSELSHVRIRLRISRPSYSRADLEARQNKLDGEGEGRGGGVGEGPSFSLPPPPSIFHSFLNLRRPPATQASIRLIS